MSEEKDFLLDDTPLQCIASTNESRKVKGLASKKFPIPGFLVIANKHLSKLVNYTNLRKDSNDDNILKEVRSIKDLLAEIKTFSLQHERFIEKQDMKIARLEVRINDFKVQQENLITK